MLVLRSVLTRALAARTSTPQVCSSFATGPRQSDGTFYEFRTYYLKPSKMNEFLENFKKNVHLRTAHSELVGYWSVEFGGRMNKVFHIWKYDNYAHRTEVRKALAKDKEWQEQFLIPNLTLIDKQESEITYLVPWCKLEKPPKEGIYELVTFQMKPGGPALWGDAFKRAVVAHANLGYSKLVGVFHTEYGALNRGTVAHFFFESAKDIVHALWWNENADSRAAGRHQSHEDPRVVAAVVIFHKEIQFSMFHGRHRHVNIEGGDKVAMLMLSGPRGALKAQTHTLGTGLPVPRHHSCAEKATHTATAPPSCLTRGV